MLYIHSNIIINIHIQNLFDSCNMSGPRYQLSIELKVSFPLNYHLLYFRWLIENRNLKCARVTYVINGKNHIKLHPSSCANNVQFDKVLFSISNSDCDRVKSSITMSISIFSCFFFRYNFDDCFHIDVRALFLFTQNHC